VPLRSAPWRPARRALLDSLGRLPLQEKENDQDQVPQEPQGRWIFEWDPILDKNPNLYEVTEEEAFPERFIPVAAIAAVAAKRGRPRKQALDLTTNDIPEEPAYNNDALNADASKGLLP